LQRVESILHCDRPYDNMCVSVKNNNNATCGSPIFRGNNVIRLVSRRILETCKTIQGTRLWYHGVYFFPYKSRHVLHLMFTVPDRCVSVVRRVRAVLPCWQWLDICSRLLFCMRVQTKNEIQNSQYRSTESNNNKQYILAIVISYDNNR